jgi:hypothetical protein
MVKPEEGTRRGTRMICALVRTWLHRTWTLSTLHGPPGQECPPPARAERSDLAFSVSARGVGPVAGRWLLQSGRLPRTDRLRSCWGPGGRGGELGWRFGVYPA